MNSNTLCLGYPDTGFCENECVDSFTVNFHGRPKHFFKTVISGQVLPVIDLSSLISAHLHWDFLQYFLQSFSFPQLCNMLNRETQITFEAIPMETQKIGLRFCPLEYQRQVNSQGLIFFFERLANFLTIMKYTYQSRPIFRQLVQNEESLRYVYVDTWNGLGAARYIPRLWRDLDDIPDNAKADINKFNLRLLDMLKSKDSAYSKGEDHNRLVYIRFGMVDQTIKIDELLNTVRREGCELETSKDWNQSVESMVLKGIELAKEELRKESSKQSAEEGVLRKIPVLGSFLDYWAPMNKDTGLRGRAFNLTSGKDSES